LGAKYANKPPCFAAPTSPPIILYPFIRITDPLHTAYHTPAATAIFFSRFLRRHPHTPNSAPPREMLLLIPAADRNQPTQNLSIRNQYYFNRYPTFCTATRHIAILFEM
jgi:hypothetical protein